MDGILTRITSPDGILAVGPVLLLFVYVAYKEWPELQKRISSGVIKEKMAKDADESISSEIRELNRKILAIEEKLINDYTRINRLERENDQIRKLAEASLEERHIMMECNLALLKSVRELGANGPTGVKEAEEKLQNYLNRRAHIIGWEAMKYENKLES